MDISEVAKHAGGVVALSKALGLSRGAVSQWTVVPSERVLAVCELTGWKCTPHLLRPDLYPNPGDALPAHLAPSASTPPCQCVEALDKSGTAGLRAGDRRSAERRQYRDEPDCDLGEPRDGDRRQEERRKGGEAEAAV